MNVSLISHTPNPEALVATAAKLCYSNSNINEILEKQDNENSGKFIKYLMDMGHESPLEHASFTFAVEDVSRSLLAQITRHRVASFSVQSQRYVNMDNAEFTAPPAIVHNEDEELLKHYARFMDISLRTYSAIKDKLFADYIKQGISEKDAEKKAQEDARFVLPNACNTRLIVTMNARELLHFFSLRCCNRAQWEIRQLADAMLSLVKQVAPNIFEYAGPSCVKGFCKEGKMSCGKSRKDELLNVTTK